jgi:putative flippase GtrA
VIGRFAVVGVLNTLIDAGLFLVLHGALGVFWANFVSTSTGMAFSFVVNGRYTFRSDKVTLRQLGAFLVTNAFTMWLLQPAVIVLATRIGDGTGAPDALVLPAAKAVAIGCSFVVNFVSYRWVVWRA